MDLLKIAHIPYTGMMYETFNKHMIDMCNLESMYGMESRVLPSISYFTDKIPIGYDLIHIHGIPHIDNSLSFLNFIRNLYINNQKFVISAYNYGLLCERFILQDENRKSCLNFKDCKKDECINTRNIYNFLKDVNIFVYSDNIYNLLYNNEYINVKKIPIATGWKQPDYYFDDNKYNNNNIELCGYFSYDTIFELENKQILNMINNHNYNFQLYNYDDIIDCGKMLLNYQWNSTFPYELYYSLANGCSIIINNEFDFKVNNLDKFINKIDLSSDISDILSKKIDKDIIRSISYEYWRNYGPHYCISYYDSYYRDILK